MNDIIHLLPDNIANQIAAGEVIQRPASAVKELLENAIDAGATQIKLEIREAGREMIRVCDNGKGMSISDARMAFERHATSKIAAVDDLFKLRTMGFRGEALASIAAVSQVELITKREEDEHGIQLIISGSELVSTAPITAAKGSIFSVKNLFYNVPARRRFLKSNDTEYRHIYNEFERVALVNPDISFVLYNGDTLSQELPAATLRKRIIDIQGKRLEKLLLSFEIKNPIVNIHGFVGKPDSARKRGAMQYFFANGRYIKHPYLHRAVMLAYDQLIPLGTMPNYFIYFDIDPSQIDVNIHPTKTEVKFTDEHSVWTLLKAVVREALTSSIAAPSIDFDQQKLIEIPEYKQNLSTPLSVPKVELNKSYNPFKNESDPLHPHYNKDNQKGTESSFSWESLYKDFESRKEEEHAAEDISSSTLSTSLDISFEETKQAPVTNGKTKAHEEALCYIYGNKYIVTSLSRGLALIDIRRAHMRIIYERFLNDERSNHIEQQSFIFPEIVELKSSDEPIIEKAIEQLNQFGFEIASLGQGSYSLLAAPSIVMDEAYDLITELINGYVENEIPAQDEFLKIVATKIAEFKAIPNGGKISQGEANDLLAELFASSEPSYCPQGKIIISVIEESDIEKRFA